MKNTSYRSPDAIGAIRPLRNSSSLTQNSPVWLTSNLTGRVQPPVATACNTLKRLLPSQCSASLAVQANHLFSRIFGRAKSLSLLPEPDGVNLVHTRPVTVSITNP